METLKLPKRLAAAAEMIRPGVGVADVGSDHGKLAAWLTASGHSPRVFATDISAPSLEKAKELFARLKIEDVATAVLGDGLAGVSPQSVGDVVVAGLGAETTLGVIAAAPWLKSADKRLVLVPSARAEVLREGLYGAGFEITAEKAVLENGRCYAVMNVGYGGEKKQISPEFAAAGKIGDAPEAGDNAVYLAQVLKKQKRKLSGLKNAANPNEAALAKTAKIIDYIEDVLKPPNPRCLKGERI